MITFVYFDVYILLKSLKIVYEQKHWQACRLKEYSTQIK